MSTWVFAYGSLVSPESVAHTIGRVVDDPTDRVVTLLNDYGRRWNYGSARLRGNWAAATGPVRGGIVISLGLTRADGESCNGVSIRVTGDELAALDVRESDYEMTDITDQVTVEADRFSDRIVTFVPRPSAIGRYEDARDAGRAAIRAEYVTLVHAAFDTLGAPHRQLFDATPDPDVPIVEIDLIWP